MAYAAVYPAGTRDHVVGVNDGMLAELEGRPCPRCNCRQSRAIEGDDDGLPLRVCVACDEVYGYDDSTNVPDHLLQDAQNASSYGGGVWDDSDGFYPRQPSPCFVDADSAADWSSGKEDEAVDRDRGQHYPEFSDPPRGGGGGRGRRGGRGGGGRGGGRGHHHGGDRPHHHHQHHHHHHGGHGRGGQRGGRGGHGGGGQTSPSNGSDPWKQAATTCLQSTSKCALGVASDLVAGRYGSAVATVSDEMEPVGRAVGGAIGSVTGNLIGSPNAGDIAAGIGSTVGRGMAEMIKDSSLCGRRSPSPTRHH